MGSIDDYRVMPLIGVGYQISPHEWFRYKIWTSERSIPTVGYHPFCSGISSSHKACTSMMGYAIYSHCSPFIKHTIVGESPNTILGVILAAILNFSKTDHARKLYPNFLFITYDPLTENEVKFWGAQNFYKTLPENGLNCKTKLWTFIETDTTSILLLILIEHYL